MEISTITCTCKLDEPVDIIALGKYMKIDESILGIKIVYAGDMKVVRGTSKLSKKKHDFLNQCTITLKTKDFICSIKVFKTGVIHFTGIKEVSQAQEALLLLKKKITSVSGCKMIALKESKDNLLLSHDNLIYNHNGKVIGSYGTKKIFIQNEQVNWVSVSSLKTVDSPNVFESIQWTNNCKNIYSVNGTLIGKKTLEFEVPRKVKRQYHIREGYVFFHGKIVGKEKIEFDIEKYNNELEKMKYFLEKKLILHYYNALPATSTTTIPVFSVHMINGYFKVSKEFISKQLHQTFLDLGYYSRFDPSVASSVNLRFHYNDSLTGKCPDKNKASCLCKDISVLCFSSGKINVTGLNEFSQGKIIYEFMMNFFKENNDKF